MQKYWKSDEKLKRFAKSHTDRHTINPVKGFGEYCFKRSSGPYKKSISKILETDEKGKKRITSFYKKSTLRNNDNLLL